MKEKATGKVLVILSSEDRLILANGNRMETGFYLNELTVPLVRLLEAGYTPVFANPRGNTPAMDQRSDSAIWFKNEQEHIRQRQTLFRMPAFLNIRKLEDILASNLNDFDGVFIPGGHAPMQDLCANEDLGRILRHFHDAGKPTGAICHGPIALLSTLNDPQAFFSALEEGRFQEARDLARDWPYRNYRLTSFTNIQERTFILSQLLTGPRGNLRFYAQTALEAAGARFKSRLLGKVVSDRELITGQGPAADEHFGAVFVDALTEARSTNARTPASRMKAA